jgi:hypothetical protein
MTSPTSPLDTQITTNTAASDLFYKIAPENWYQTFPFAFEIKYSDSKRLAFGPIPQGDSLLCRFYLPIPPQNYTIQDMSTAEATATIGGVVEEVNAPVFSMITLVGTTGLSINSPSIKNGVGQDLSINQRKLLDEVTKTGSVLGRILRSVQNTVTSPLSFIEPENDLPFNGAPSAVNTTPHTITKMFNNAPDNAVAGWFERQNPFQQTKIPKGEFSNGWAWSQALRQFFMIYARWKSVEPNLELYFSDYKSRASYRCVPRSVQFQQNAQNPYLINYTIILKCWELQDVEKKGAGIPKAVDRFAGDLAEVNTASITGVVSRLGTVANSLNRFPSVAGSFLRNSSSIL